MCSSVARRWLLPRREAAFLSHAEKPVIEIDGVKLLVHLNLRRNRPLVMIVPGWLGCFGSSYVISAAKHLWQAGYSVARLNLRDHGYTAHLNPELFNSARIDEVVALAAHLHELYGVGRSGLLGYSLGGNFALRINRQLPQLATLALCPALDPAATMAQIDANFIYQRYFVRKWRAMLDEKQQAFPERYDFSAAAKLTTVSALTDYFVRYHSTFANTDEYFAAYDLSRGALAEVDASILAAKDDPVIPLEQYEQALSYSGLQLELTERGGHGAYLRDWRLNSWVDEYAQQFFDRRLNEQ